MKKTTLLTICGIFTCVICIHQLWVSLHIQPEETCYDEQPENRLTIAFILGEDKEADNPYYDEAYQYYANNPEEKADTVIRTCRSLVDVKNYIAAHKPSNCLPWGTVHLVSHGNQWNGLSVKVSPDSKRATTERILSYTNSNLSDTLSEDILDDKTTIFLHGCGVGNDRTLVDAVGEFFGGRAVVVAPMLFEYYASATSETGLQSQRYLAQSWLVSYPMEQRPSLVLLSNEFREKYPSAKTNWIEALSKETPAWVGDVYHYTFEVPVKWIIAVDSLPDLNSESKQINWLYAQQSIVSELKRLQIPIEKFSWAFNTGYTGASDGKSPAVFVKGYCTMLCVLQALVEGNDRSIQIQKPFVPALTDGRFYYRSAQTNPLSSSADHIQQCALLSK